MSQQYLVIGVGRFGSAVARQLHDLGQEVIAVDSNEAELQKVMGEVSYAAVVDATDDHALAEIGVAEVDTVIVAIGDNLEASILATVAAKAAGAPRVITKANDDISARVLISVGADEIVRPEHDMGIRLADQLVAPDQVALLETGPNHHVVDLEVGDRLTGVLSELHLPQKFGVQVLSVRRGDDVTVAPPATFQLRAGDRILVLGHNDDLGKLRRYLGQ